MNLQADSIGYLGTFLAGVGMSLTPCIYPLIPVTAGYIGATAAGSKLKGFLLSLIYVTGVAVTYSILGLFASLTGTIFGKISTHPLTYFLVGGIVILFGVSMLGVFTISLPQLIKFPSHKKQNYLSTFFFGLSSGLIVSPCLTPALLSILLYLTTKQNILHGITLLLSFAYGMGLILILTGTFSTILSSLPKSGKWMVYIKKISALVLIGMGLYFITLSIRRL